MYIEKPDFKMLDVNDIENGSPVDSVTFNTKNGNVSVDAKDLESFEIENIRKEVLNIYDCEVYGHNYENTSKVHGSLKGNIDLGNVQSVSLNVNDKKITIDVDTYGVKNESNFQRLWFDKDTTGFWFSKHTHDYDNEYKVRDYNYNPK